MRRRTVLAHEADFEGWRNAARALLAAEVPPARAEWQVGDQPGLLGMEAEDMPVAGGGLQPRVPAAFLALAQTVALHRDAERFGLLYLLLWRIVQGERDLLSRPLDPAFRRAEQMVRQVHRDQHKMKAFVRFREIRGDRIRSQEGSHFVAWFEPEHHIVEATAPFFAERFAGMVWSILTPERSVHWDGEELHALPGAVRADAAGEDGLEEVWRTYYASIFNPARLKLDAMRGEMPVKYWKNLPEARLIRPLTQAAGRRTTAMIATPATEPARRLPQSIRPALEAPLEGLEALGRDAAGCRRCPLWKDATATVWGEGRAGAPIMLVGEQPGDQEDVAGRPFVGPAGQLLDRALAEAGLPRDRLYVTNAVKHFKFEPRGKRRIHQRPNAGEVDACRWWLDREIALVRPRLVVALGATAARGLFQRAVSIGQERGRPLPFGEGRQALITVHPSYLLRLPDEAAKREACRGFVADLAQAAAYLDEAVAA